MNQEHVSPVSYQLPKSKLTHDAAQASNDSIESSVNDFLEELRKGILQQLRIAAEEEYKLYRQQFDKYRHDIAQRKTYAYKQHIVEDEGRIWRHEVHLARALESICAIGKQHLRTLDERLSTILKTLLRLTSISYERDFWYQDYTYRHMVIKGLLRVYISHRSTLDEAVSMEEKILFTLYALEQILPDGSDYGGPGLAAYSDSAYLLASLNELGFDRRADLLRISTAADFDIDCDELEDAEASALVSIMGFKRKIAFFTCADLFIDAGLWLEEKLTFDIAKRFGADPYHERSYSASFVRAAVSAFNEDSGWKCGRFTLTDQEMKHPIHHVAALRQEAWATIDDRSTTVEEKITLAARSNYAMTSSNRMSTNSMRDHVGVIDKKTFEKVFGIGDADELLALVEARIACL